jgi:hypothetical protein
MMKVPDHVYVLGYTYTCHTLKKRKEAEYAKQYRLKRKLLMQRQDSTFTETHSPPSKRRYDGASKT